MEQSIFSKRVSELIESRGKTPTSVAYDIGITPDLPQRHPGGRQLIKTCRRPHLRPTPLGKRAADLLTGPPVCGSLGRAGLFLSGRSEL